MTLHVDFAHITHENNQIHFGKQLSISPNEISEITSVNPFSIEITTNTTILIESLYGPIYDTMPPYECTNIPEHEMYYLQRNNLNKIQYLMNLVSESKKIK